MTTRRLSRTEARRIAIRAQLLDAPRPRGLLTMARRLTMLQLDPTAVVAPNADLVAWSRLGDSYRPAHLTQALETKRTMFEHRAQLSRVEPAIAMALPMAHLRLHMPEMRALRDRPGRVNAWLEANAGFRDRVLDQLRASGPLSSRDIPDTAKVPWQSTGWTHDRNVTQLLEFLASRGLVAVAGRDGKQRLWDVADRIYPAQVDVLSADEAERLRTEQRLRSMGIASPKVVGEAGVPAEVEGSENPWRLDPRASANGFEGRSAILSPFDRLIHDRVRAADLFDFEFTLEIYKPKDQRRWGYFAMPILHGDRLVGKVDATANREESRLDVHATHEDVPFTRPIKRAVDDELAALAAWLGLVGVRVG